MQFGYLVMLLSLEFLCLWVTKSSCCSDVGTELSRTLLTLFLGECVPLGHSVTPGKPLCVCLVFTPSCFHGANDRVGVVLGWEGIGMFRN